MSLLLSTQICDGYHNHHVRQVAVGDEYLKGLCERQENGTHFCFIRSILNAMLNHGIDGNIVTTNDVHLKGCAIHGSDISEVQETYENEILT